MLLDFFSFPCFCWMSSRTCFSFSWTLSSRTVVAVNFLDEGTGIRSVDLGIRVLMPSPAPFIFSAVFSRLSFDILLMLYFDKCFSNNAFLFFGATMEKCLRISYICLESDHLPDPNVISPVQILILRTLHLYSFLLNKITSLDFDFQDFLNSH
jgi:hypothetical protein